MRGCHAHSLGYVVVAMALFWMGTAFASDVIVGSVLAVRGQVFSDTGSGQQPLTANAPVHLGDTIVSAAGKAKIALGDGTIISVGENSSIRVADYQHTANDFSTRVRLIAGALRSLVAKVTPVGKFEIETETAIAAVRGTDWLIEATPEQTSVALVSGAVAVSGRNGPAQTTVVLSSAQEGTDVRRGNAPSPAAQWSARRFADALARASFD